MRNYDHDLALAVERHADPEGERQADEAYAAYAAALWLDELKAALPGWRVWRSEMTGSYGAQRDRTCYMDQSPERLQERCLAVVNAGTCRDCGKRPAATEYTEGWWVCEVCARLKCA